MRLRELAVGAVVLLAMLGLFLWRPAAIDRLELNLLDWRFRLRGPVAPEMPIAIVAIDAKSLDDLGRWPWRRDVVATLLDRLGDSGVLAIGFDAIFAERETPADLAALQDALLALGMRRDAELDNVRAVIAQTIRDADTDSRLEQALARSDRTAMGFFFRTNLGEEVERSGGPVPLDELARQVRRSRIVERGEPTPEALSRLLTCTDVEPSLPRFNEAAERSGYINATKDRDGAVRRAALVASCGGARYPALSVAVLAVAAGRPAMLLWDENGVDRIRVADVEIPVNEGGRVLVNYLGPPQTFPHYSASDVVLGRVDPEQLANHIVFIGPTEIGERDTHATPFHQAAPGVEVHATLLENYLTGSVLPWRENFIAELAAVAVGGLLTMIAVPLLGTALRGALFAALLLASYVTGAAWAFVEHGVWLNLAYPGLTVIAVYLAVAVSQGASQEARTRWIRSTFATFVPPDVVDEMIENPGSFQVGGQRKPLGLLFSDIRGFTSISEELGAEDTTRLLNEYLTPMTKIIFDSRGTLDKYIGDAIVAFWGAPLPVPDHAVRVAVAAVAMQEGVRELNRRGDELRGAEQLRIGIGIHTAEVNVGKMGSELRFDYTVTGDGVNLCARLEGLTKYYGAGVLASDTLVAELPPEFLTRELDSIRVKGKQEPVRIFEVIGRRAPEPAEHRWLEVFAAGLGAYRGGDWKEASRALHEARELRAEGDPACDLLLERIAHLERDPPDEWDGIWTFETK